MQKNGGRLHKAVSNSNPFSFLEVGVLLLPPTPPVTAHCSLISRPGPLGQSAPAPTIPQKSITHPSTPQHPYIFNICSMLSSQNHVGLINSSKSSHPRYISILINSEPQSESTDFRVSEAGLWGHAPTVLSSLCDLGRVSHLPGPRLPHLTQKRLHQPLVPDPTSHPPPPLLPLPSLPPPGACFALGAPHSPT